MGRNQFLASSFAPLEDDASDWVSLGGEVVDVEEEQVDDDWLLVPAVDDDAACGIVPPCCSEAPPVWPQSPCTTGKRKGRVTREKRDLRILYNLGRVQLGGIFGSDKRGNNCDTLEFWLFVILWENLC